MGTGRSPSDRRAASLVPTVPPVALQTTTTTPSPGVGVGELADFWPAVVRVGWFFAGFLGVVVLSRFLLEPPLSRVLRRRNRNNPTLRDAIMLYFRVFVTLVAVFVGVGVAGYGRILSSSALIIGAATLAVGVSGQQVVGSFVSGTTLVFDSEFNVGNYIEWADGEGTVRSISLRVTRVKTPNGGLVTIPNTVLTSQTISRPFGRGRYRVVERVELPPGADVDEAMNHLEEAARALDQTLAEPAPTVYVDELDDDAPVLRVHYWITDPQRRDVYAVRSAYARAVRARFDGAGVTVRSAPDA